MLLPCIPYTVHVSLYSIPAPSADVSAKNSLFFICGECTMRSS